MKSYKLFSMLVVCLAMAGQSFAQSKTEKLKVSGECGMCKKKIESAAKESGATYALWNKDSKILTVTYNSQNTNSAKIQQNIAAVGYDTPEFKATDEAYNSLDDCCKYQRSTSSKASHASMDGSQSCSDKCEKKDGKCASMESCKEKGCCKDGEACKKGDCCKKS
jgi:mercuric ion binding protein